jgi:hypothetical protein
VIFSNLHSASIERVDGVATFVNDSLAAAGRPPGRTVAADSTFDA